MYTLRCPHCGGRTYVAMSNNHWDGSWAFNDYVRRCRKCQKTVDAYPTMDSAVLGKSPPERMPVNMDKGDSNGIQNKE